MKKILIALFIGIVFLNSQVSAGEPTEAAKQPETTEAADVSEEHYLFPVIPPEVTLTGGYRFVSDRGAATADEYEYLHNSPVFGGDVRYFSFPHRFHLNLDFENRKDYYGDINYAYEDIVIFRGINRTLYHNLDNLTLIDTNPADSLYRVTRRDPGNLYGVKVGMSNFFLRFKTHDFPFHVYAEGGLVTRDGSQQQRFYLGSTNPSSGYRTSDSRNTDWQTKALTVGVNSHFGPIEIDYSHGEKWFSVNGDAVLFDPYAAVTQNATRPARAAGDYAHNLIPELRGSSDTLKLHTSYTGGLVASATLSKLDRENRDSGARATHTIAAGEITWVAAPKLTFFLKYRHKEADIDNPSDIRVSDRTGINIVTYGKNDGFGSIKDSISSSTDTVTGIVRYRPVSGVVFRGEIIHDVVNRTDAAEWGIPDKTTRNLASLSADVRLMKNLNAKVKYTHKDIEHPANNVEPDWADEIRTSVSWVPTPRLNAMVSYGWAKEKRSELVGLVNLPADDREVLRDRFLGSLTYLVLNDLSLTASYAYMHNKTAQDIASGTVTDLMVPNKIFAHFYGADLNYTPKTNLTIGAGISYTLSSGTFYPSEPDLLNPSIAAFSELRTKETVYHVSGEYRFKHGFSVGVQYKYSRLDDAIDNAYDDVQDGRAHIVFLTLSKKW
ncbi:MAG: MtrB/PioB family outer membrane beta-barrel protein [Nitrospirae bacterium]|nr:MtrB/PioB family outer membrane beta-barrel protein [Nitrospirota bacterium]